MACFSLHQAYIEFLLQYSRYMAIILESKFYIGRDYYLLSIPTCLYCWLEYMYQSVKIYLKGINSSIAFCFNLFFLNDRLQTFPEANFSGWRGSADLTISPNPIFVEVLSTLIHIICTHKCQSFRLKWYKLLDHPLWGTIYCCKHIKTQQFRMAVCGTVHMLHFCGVFLENLTNMFCRWIFYKSNFRGFSKNW